MSKQIHIVRNVGNAFGNGTYFIPLMGDLNGTSATTEATNSTPWSVAGVFSNLKVELSAAPGTGVTDVFTLRINGVDTGITVTISGAAAVLASDTTHTASIAVGDRVTLKRVHTGGTGASSVVSFSFDFDSTNAGELGFTSCQRQGIGTPSTPALRTGLTGFNVAGWSDDSVGIYTYLDVVGAAGSLTRYDVHDYSGSSPGSGNSFTFVIYRNGVKQDGSGGTVDTRSSYGNTDVSTSWTGSLPVAVGDSLFLEMHFTGSPSAWQTPQFSCRFLATTAGQFWLRGPGGFPNQVNPRFSTVGAFTGVGWSTPESARQALSAVTTFYVTAIYESHVNDSNPANTLRLTFDVRVNQATSSTPVRHVDHPDLGVGLRMVIAAHTVNPAVGSFATITDSDTWGLRSTPTTVPPEVRVTQMVVLTMAPNVVACDTPSDGEDLCASLDDPVLISAWDPGDGNGRRWYTDAPGGLDDAVTYLGGWKDDRLLSVSEVRRGMANATYDYEVGNFSVEFADEDYAIRVGMGRYFNNREIEVFAVTPDGRHDQVSPKVIATGFTDADPAFDEQQAAMSVRFTCRDRIGIAMGWTSTGQAKVPRRVLTPITLPGVVPAARGLAAPFWYGRHGSGIQPSGIATVPVWDDDASRCGFIDGGILNNGYGDGVLPAPSGFAVSAVSGGSMPDQDFYVQVYAVDGSGNLGTPSPFCFAAGVVTVAAPDSSVQVSWSAVPGAAKYYAVLGWNFFGVRPTGQFLETTGTSVTFTKSQATNQPVNFDVITPGAQIAGDGQFYFYAVRSKNGTVRSVLAQPDAFIRSEPTFPGNKLRKGRIWWQSTGAPEYEVLRRGPGDPNRPYDWMWVIPSGQYDAGAGLHYFDEDWALTGAIPLGGDTEHPAGRVKPFYSRDVLFPDSITRREFLFAGTAVRGVTDWYYDPGTSAADVEINEDDGTVWLFPKTTPSAWESYFTTKFRDVVGADGITRRYSAGYGHGPKADAVASGTARLTLNLEGIETSGAGTGDLIEDLHDIALHQLRNVIVTSGEGYLSGLWNQTPRMGFNSICVINEESFDNLKTVRQTELTGGLIAAGALGANGEQIDVSDALRRLQLSGDMRFYTNRFWQIAITAHNETLTESELSPELSDDFDIHLRTFRPMPRLSELQNIFAYNYDANHVDGGWHVENQQHINQDSVSRWRMARDGDALDFHYLTDPLVVQYVLMRIVRRKGDAPNYISLEGDKCLMSADYDVGRYFPARHWRGLSVSGWTGRPLWIQDVIYNRATGRVRLDCMDVAYLVPSGAGGFL
jgi:hypothetical protein